jgi:hypothetical protein
MVRRLTKNPAVIAISLALAAGMGLSSSTAMAADLGAVATSSVSYSSVDSNNGVISGGTPAAFDPAFGGWRAEAFDAIGQWGLQKTLYTDNPTRNVFSAWNEATTIEHGGTSSMTLSSQIITDSLTRNLADATITLKGNSIRWVIGVEEMWEGSFERMRMFFDIDLAAGSTITYDALGEGALLATDSSGEHASVVLVADATVGTVDFASRTNHTAALDDGDPAATVYINDLVGTATEVTVYAFVLDGDPCSDDLIAEAAATLAADPAGSFGATRDVSSACLSANSWSLQTAVEGPTETTIELDPQVTTPEGSTRRFSVGGLPEFITGTVDDSVSPAILTTEYSTTAIAGEYPVTVSSWLETPSGGSTSRSEPMSELITLTLVEPEPEPEPEPVPDPEPEPEIAVVVVEEQDPVEQPAPSESSRDNDDEEEQWVEVTPAPAPTPAPVPAREPEGIDESEPVTEVSEPDFQLQDSTPATPLPEAPPTTDSAAITPATTTANLWTSWWLWAIVGLSAIWWAWLGWSPLTARKAKRM